MAGSRRSAYRPYNPRWFNRLVRLSFGIYLSRHFRIHCIGKELFNTLKPPFVIIPNHVAMLDSLMVGSNVPQPIYWIASDGNMRTTFMRFVLKLVGTIPKSKYIPDLETINGIVEVVRKRKGVIGIFPEGTATFDGHTRDLVPATGKLLKLLKVPVVTAIVKGAYHSMPRWSWTNRLGRVEIEFKLAISAEETKQLKADEIFMRLKDALEYDEAEWQKERQIPYSGKARAENLQTVLFRCPTCGDDESMRSLGHRFTCEACGASWYLDRYYRLRPQGGNLNPQGLGTIRDWSLWQEKSFAAALRQRVGSKGKPLFSDNVSIFLGRKLNPLRKVETGRFELYPDRMQLNTPGRMQFTALEAGQGNNLMFPLTEIEGEGIFKRNILEFYHNRSLYQVRFPSRNSSALKWLLAFGVLRGLASTT
jgi:1-acyl-sn-glycerol-3-phosphate acyltransferase